MTRVKMPGHTVAAAAMPLADLPRILPAHVIFMLIFRAEAALKLKLPFLN